MGGKEVVLRGGTLSCGVSVALWSSVAQQQLELHRETSLAGAGRQTINHIDQNSYPRRSRLETTTTRHLISYPPQRPPPRRNHE